ncbi:MAG: hypothetical protein AAB131_09770, partial [Actinomycetota bacterium]
MTGSVAGTTVRLESGSEVVGSVISRGALFSDGRPAEAITFRQVIEQIDGPMRFFECLYDPQMCEVYDGCELNGVWREA